MSSSEQKKSTSSGSSRSGTQAMSIRMSDELSDRLEEVAEIYRRQTGGKHTASSMARTFIEIGLNEFERRGGLVVSQ